MKAYIASYTKKDGSVRQMFFAKISDLPKEFLSSKLKGTGKPKTLSESRELVWDLEKKSFRTINYETLIGQVFEVQIDEEDLV